jgi:hypothetical protein
MAIELIDVGNIANDGTGESLRNAFIKINNNTAELDSRQGERNTASNLGTGNYGLFSQKVITDLQFKELVPGDNIVLSANETGITISTTAINTWTISGDTGSKTLSSDDSVLTVVGGSNIDTSVAGNVLTIDGTFQLEDDPDPRLAANLDLDGFDIIGNGNINITGTVTAGTLNANLEGNLTGNLTGNSTGAHTGPVYGPVYGDVTGLVNGTDPAVTENILNTFDMGTITGIALNPIQWIISQGDFDMGTFSNPAINGIDGGTII